MDPLPAIVVGMEEFGKSTFELLLCGHEMNYPEDTIMLTILSAMLRPQFVDEDKGSSEHYR